MSISCQAAIKGCKQEGLRTSTIDDNYSLLQQTTMKLTDVEHSFYTQWAKAIYLKEEDRNTSFFHALVKWNNKWNEIIAVKK